ncbi:hypothetical protein [Rhizobium sp. PAMB 3182]
MSGLRFFEDTMHALIARDRELAAIHDRAATYSAACQRIRQANLPHSSARPNSHFIAATEGQCAARIILTGKAET